MTKQPDTVAAAFVQTLAPDQYPAYADRIAERPAAPDATCAHQAWEQHGTARRCADCREPLPDAEVTSTVTGPTRAVLDEVYAERARQDDRWGEQNHPDGTGNRDQQRYAEFRQKWCKDAFGAGYGTWADILAEEVAEAEGERDPARLRAELIQVAAVAVCWAEAIDRRTTTAATEQPAGGEQ